MPRFRKLSEKPSTPWGYRREVGQAMISEGAAMLSLLVFISIGLIFLVLNVGMTMVYQQKVAFIAAQAANYYNTQSIGWNYQNNSAAAVDVNTFSKTLAGTMGLNPTNISASATPGGPNIISVTVTGTNLPLIANSFLPGTVSVHDTFSANTSSTNPRPTGLLSINCINATAGNHTVLVPCYSGDFPSDIVSSDPYAPHIPGPGTFDQWSLAIPAQPPGGIGLTFTPGNRGSTP